MEIREIPARIDRETLTLLRQWAGMTKLLIGMAKSLRDAGGVPGMSPEATARAWDALTAIHGELTRLAKRLS